MLIKQQMSNCRRTTIKTKKSTFKNADYAVLSQWFFCIIVCTLAQELYKLRSVTSSNLNGKKTDLYGLLKEKNTSTDIIYLCWGVYPYFEKKSGTFSTRSMYLYCVQWAHATQRRLTLCLLCVILFYFDF